MLERQADEVISTERYERLIQHLHPVDFSLEVKEDVILIEAKDDSFTEMLVREKGQPVATDGEDIKAKISETYLRVSGETLKVEDEYEYVVEGAAPVIGE
jgi:hypothetical protein